MDELGCDFCVHGDDDATTADGKDAFAEAKAAGRMAIVKRTEGVSTTDLVKRLLAMTKSHHTPVTRALASSPHLLATTPASDAVPDMSLPPAHAGPSAAAAAGVASPASPNPSPQPSTTQQAVSSFLPTTWRISQFANHRVPKSTDKVVYIAGSFDLFHLGHIEKLEEAKKLVSGETHRAAEGES
jgi:ethanolamine-phosphate cytidylyltransferase